MIQGKIIKGISSFYYVKAGDEVYECSARGVFRKKDISLYIGDNVEILLSDQESLRGEYQTASIQRVLNRKNKMQRPPVANVDQGIVVVPATQPKPNLDLIDRLLILVEEQEIDACICINKIDLDKAEKYREIIESYEKAGYKVITTSATEKIGIDSLRDCLKDKTSFLAGNSGVGKSELLNAVDPLLNVETGALSAKIKRGKHTTRHVELMPLSVGGYVLDTPGFSSVSVEHIEEDELRHYFREFKQYEGRCKFTGCSHIHEPGCIVKEGLNKGKIDSRRYENYTRIYNELKDVRRW